jgi:hypothetical protein
MRSGISDCRPSTVDYLDAGDPKTGSLGRCRQRRDVVQQTVVSTVHEEAEMCEKIGSDEGLRDVSYYKAPCEFPA